MAGRDLQGLRCTAVMTNVQERHLNGHQVPRVKTQYSNSAAVQAVDDDLANSQITNNRGERNVLKGCDLAHNGVYHKETIEGIHMQADVNITTFSQRQR